MTVLGLSSPSGPKVSESAASTASTTLIATRTLTAPAGLQPAAAPLRTPEYEFIRIVNTGLPGTTGHPHALAKNETKAAHPAGKKAAPEPREEGLELIAASMLSRVGDDDEANADEVRVQPMTTVAVNGTPVIRDNSLGRTANGEPSPEPAG